MGVALAIASTTTASAYQPSPASLYTATDAAACNKSPCVLYPKSAQLPSGRIVATFEDSETAPVGQTLPVYRSDDDGTTWAKLSDVKAPAYLSGDSRYAKYTSNWTNPYLYVLPQAVGGLSAGTLLLASAHIVSPLDDEVAEGPELPQAARPRAAITVTAATAARRRLGAHGVPSDRKFDGLPTMSFASPLPPDSAGKAR